MTPKMIQSYQSCFFSFRSRDHCLIFNRAVNLCPVMGSWPPLSRDIGQESLLLHCGSWTATIVSLKGRARSKTVYSQYLISHALLVFCLFGTIIMFFFLFYPFGMGMSNLFLFCHFILEAYNLLGFVSWQLGRNFDSRWIIPWVSSMSNLEYILDETSDFRPNAGMSQDCWEYWAGLNVIFNMRRTWILVTMGGISWAIYVPLKLICWNLISKTMALWSGDHDSRVLMNGMSVLIRPDN